jgi:hypothetical protein
MFESIILIVAFALGMLISNLLHERAERKRRLQHDEHLKAWSNDLMRRIKERDEQNEN